METAILVRWYLDDGQIVLKDEPMCEIETPKSSVDVPAPKSGILRHLARAGDVIRPDMDVARIDPIS